MAVALRSVGTATAAASATSLPSIGLPAGVATNDIMLMEVVARAAAATISGPAGWTQIGSQSNPSSNHRFALFYKQAGGSETAPTVTADLSCNLLARISAWSGCDTSTPIDAAGSCTTQANNNLTAAAPSITTATANAVVVWFFSTGGSATFSSYTAGVEAYQTNYSSGFTHAFSAAYLTQASAGASGTSTVTSSSAANNWGLGVVALRPATTTATSPTFRAAGAVGGTDDGTSVTPGLPTGLLAGDLMVMPVATQGSGATIATPSGWTAVAAQLDVAATHRMRTFYRLAGVSETAPTVTVDVSGPLIAVIAAFSGVDQADVLAATSATNSTASNTTGTASALTTDTNGALAIYCWSTPTNNNVGTYSAGTEVVEVDGTAAAVTTYDPGPDRAVSTLPEAVGRVMGYILSDGSSTLTANGWGTTSNPSTGDFTGSGLRASEFRRCLNLLGMVEGSSPGTNDYAVRSTGNTAVNLAALATQVNAALGTSITKADFLIGDNAIGLPPGYTRVMVQAFLASILEMEAPAAASTTTVKICDYNTSTARDNTEAILDSEGLDCTQSGNDLRVNRAALDAFPMPLIVPTDNAAWRYPSTDDPAPWPEASTTFTHTLAISTLEDAVAGALSAPTAQTSSSQTWGTFSLALKPAATVTPGGKIPHPFGLADRQARGNIPPSLVWITRNIGWGDIETSNGSYTWTDLDAAIVAADAVGAKVLIRAIGGAEAPTWVKNAVPSVLVYHQEQSDGPPVANPVEGRNTNGSYYELVPVPSNATLMTHLKSFIDDLVARYDSDSRVLGFHAAGINEVHGEPMVTWQDQGTLDRYDAAGYDYDDHRAALIEQARYYCEQVQYSTVAATFNGGWSTPRGQEGSTAARTLVSDICTAMLGESAPLITIQHHGFGLPWRDTTGGPLNSVGLLYQLLMAIRDANPGRVTITPQTTSTRQFVERAGFANARAGMEWCVDTAEQYAFYWVEVPVDLPDYATTGVMEDWHDRIVAAATAHWALVGPPAGTTHALAGTSTIGVTTSGTVAAARTWVLAGRSVIDVFSSAPEGDIGAAWSGITDLRLAVEVAFDADPLDPSPEWTDISEWVLSVNTLRGRTSELVQGYPPGSLEVLLDNRDGRFDPSLPTGPYYGQLVPNRQIRVRAQWDGVVYPIAVGYVSRWAQNRDMLRLTVTVPAVDGFRLLSDMVMPENALQAAVGAADPLVYWPLSSADGRDVSGNDYHGAIGGATAVESIVPAAPSTVGAAWFIAGGCRASIPQTGEVRTVLAWVDFDAASSFTLFAAAGAGDYTVLRVEPQFSGAGSSAVIVNTSNSADDREAVEAFVPLHIDNGTHMLAVTVTQSAVTVYVDGRAAGTVTPTTGTDTDLGLGLCGITISSGGLTASDFAVHTSALSASTIAGIYAAGACGYREERTGRRIARILDSAGWPSSRRRIGQGQSYVTAWQPSARRALEEVREVEASEQGRLFMSPDGWVTFLDRDWQWIEAAGSISQATFGDDVDAGELPYVSITTSDADGDLIRNIVEVTSPGGQRTTTDADSVTAYGEHVEQVGTQLLLPEMAANLGHYRVRRFADPSSRVTSLGLCPSANAGLIPVVLGLDIGTRVTVRRRPNGVLIDEDYVIESVAHTFDEGKVTWMVEWYLAPAVPNADEGSYLVAGDVIGPTALVPF